MRATHRLRLVFTTAPKAPPPPPQGARHTRTQQTTVPSAAQAAACASPAAMQRIPRLLKLLYGSASEYLFSIVSACGVSAGSLQKGKKNCRGHRMGRRGRAGG